MTLHSGETLLLWAVNTQISDWTSWITCSARDQIKWNHCETLVRKKNLHVRAGVQLQTHVKSRRKWGQKHFKLSHESKQTLWKERLHQWTFSLHRSNPHRCCCERLIRALTGLRGGGLVWSHLWVAEITVCYHWWPQQVCRAAIGSDQPQWIKPAGGCSTCTNLAAQLGPAHHGKRFCITKTNKLYLQCMFHSTYIHI